MNDLLSNYKDARAKLSEYFGTKLWHNVVVHDDDKWVEYDDSVDFCYLGDDDSEYEEWNYSIEIYGSSRWESIDGKYTLFVGNDGCGNKDCYVFLNSLKMSEE